MRKYLIGFAAGAAATIASFAGAEETGAQAADAAVETTTEQTALTEEVVPVFVSEEVVQELPEEATSEIPGKVPQAADSLHELVAEMSAPQDLSEEMRCLAGAVYFESRGEPLNGQLAVAQVIINRTESGQFPSSYCGVVYQRSQFSFVRGGSMPRIKAGSDAWERAKKIARIAHQGLWESEADDSLYFHASYVKPRWASKKTRRAAIKTHIFYR